MSEQRASNKHVSLSDYKGHSLEKSFSNLEPLEKSKGPWKKGKHPKQDFSKKSTANLEKLSVEFTNEHETNNAIKQLTELGVKADYYKRGGTYNNKLTFINNHEFKNAMNHLHDEPLFNEDKKEAARKTNDEINQKFSDAITGKDKIQKSEAFDLLGVDSTIESLEKGRSESKSHKYVKKVGNKYFYDHSNMTSDDHDEAHKMHVKKRHYLSNQLLKHAADSEGHKKALQDINDNEQHVNTHLQLALAKKERSSQFEREAMEEAYRGALKSTQSKESFLAHLDYGAEGARLPKAEREKASEWYDNWLRTN